MCDTHALASYSTQTVILAAFYCSTLQIKGFTRSGNPIELYNLSKWLAAEWIPVGGPLESCGSDGRRSANQSTRSLLLRLLKAIQGSTAESGLSLSVKFSNMNAGLSLYFA